MAESGVDMPTKFENVTGLVGSRCIVYFDKRWFSPVYGHKEWFPNHVSEVASCAIGCATAPSDRHQGCGFHTHYQIDDTKKFIEQIRGTADCIVLVECTGRIVAHEKGFRAEKAKIIAVLDYDPRLVFFTHISSTGHAHPNVPSMAKKYFDIPMIDSQTAQLLIDRQKARLLGNHPDISYNPRL